MKTGPRAFALVLVVALLGLLLLITLALASLARAGSGLAATALYAMQARQNAMVGARTALGQLQPLLGDALTDPNVTAMGGIGGATYGDGLTRHWCGVWDSSGGRLAWLASGADQSSPSPAVLPGRALVSLLGNNSVGAPGSRPATEDREQIVVGRQPILISTSNPPRTGLESGGYAYWVGDEGVKVSLSGRGGVSVAPLVPPDPLFPAAKPPLAGNLPRVLLFEQVKFVPALALTDTQRQDLYHVLTVRHTRLAAAGETDGAININTTSATVWRQILALYNSSKEPADPAIASVSASADRIRDGLSAAANADKAGGGPFRSVAGLAGGPFMAAALGDTATNKPSARFLAVMAGALTVRSDTFRIRAYGDALNPATGEVESRAYCEMMVQRREFPFPTGRRFVVLYFRWLSPDDI